MKTLLFWMLSNIAWTIISFVIAKIYKKLSTTVDVSLFSFIMGLTAGGISTISIGYLISLSKKNLSLDIFVNILMISFLFFSILFNMLEKLNEKKKPNENLEAFAAGIMVTGFICAIISSILWIVTWFI